MKKLINSTDDVVDEFLSGMCAAHSDLICLLPETRSVMRAQGAPSKVAIISGGGCGHEPTHAGFVGFGMLDAACQGEVFTSPTPDQMYRAARAVESGAGILFLVKNYTGDVMNFQMAADMLTSDGLEVETVVINDDVAVIDSLHTAGRRGVGGAVLTEKVVGAYAESGATLSELKELAERCNANIRSMGMALTSCTVPAVGHPTFSLADNEIEIGIGIHGEPGRERTKIKSSKEITSCLTEAIVSDLPFSAGDRVLAMVNGMGGTPLSELYIVYNDLKGLLDEKGITISRSLVGNYITSLDMQGCSITLFRLDSTATALWDYPVHTPALRWGR